ncbi:hypothetical protein halTADL_0831 [Halohasta litchfieldiae]|uniref:Uncharacterized protein n=1 Tax=Halohasta litchfieldiae TaxID=1073996 RepID=A0A1H6TFU3_9EURY|nr:hypothetical protein [Halohasta litchfieldiae]ATW87628.1 hypothetical protein halTADL_0831 [Halohasta litchfieldiae]SEI77034.1 hypothetical protein SAMN05444271_107150 [Halohasta litchfieldiae]
MTESVRRFVVGRDRTVTRRILGISAVLTVAAFGTLAVPTVWAEYVSPSGAETMQLAAAVGFVLSVIAAVYVVSKTADINPYVPTAAVFVVFTSYGVTGIVTELQLVFFIGPAIFLGILVALSAYANDGALASLSVVFFPVLGYMINAPYGIAESFGLLNRFRVALVFSLIFTFTIGIAGFLTGSVIRRLVDYADIITVEELRHPDSVDPETPTDQLSSDTETVDE